MGNSFWLRTVCILSFLITTACSMYINTPKIAASNTDANFAGDIRNLAIVLFWYRSGIVKEGARRRHQGREDKSFTSELRVRSSMPEDFNVTSHAALQGGS